MGKGCQMAWHKYEAAHIAPNQVRATAATLVEATAMKDAFAYKVS